jgi:anaerobic dimethyl sulfoxide reductase subunit B (iron-sulfur subunit)
MGEQLSFYFEQKHCTGCSTCQIACKDKYDLLTTASFRKVYEIAGGTFKKSGFAWEPQVYAFWISVSCNHCEKPACIKTCRTGALQKRAQDGIVMIDKQKCIGCQQCIKSCPYGAIQLNPQTKQAVKCDFCLDRLTVGKNPVCVDACPMRVLDYGPLSSLQEKYGDIRSTSGLPDAAITKPALIISPHRDALTVFGDKKI